MEFKYDIIVVGAGHAGCEAAAASARLGAKTCLITMDMNKIAQMSCNPAVGGIAKGQIVREIDALGGHMGEVTDDCTIQFRMLNRSKGPAMWSPRAQCDRGKFIWAWRSVLENQENLSIWQDQVKELLVEQPQPPLPPKGRDNSPKDNSNIKQNVTPVPFDSQPIVVGVRTYLDVVFKARCVIITTGTFLNGLMHIGRTKLPGGRCAEPPSLLLTESITRHGIRAGRMKTGTPVRIDGRSVDFSMMTRQDGDTEGRGFSYMKSMPSNNGVVSNLGDADGHLPCWITFTNPAVHERLRQGLPDSPLFNGQIQSIGPRYCPSIETKLVTFADKEQHQLFLEPEGTNTQEYYLNGFSSSLPIDVQLEALHRIPAFRNLRVYRPGYAIEYDYFDPQQLERTLQSKLVDGLYFAGQVNGTTGYEEAAGQGLVAGINAALQCSGSQPFIMHRDESYIGVLIDDLATKGVDEPYRMFTSRAEYRILLRQDNADARLTKRAYDIGLATKERYNAWTEKDEQINRIIHFAEQFSVKANTINDALIKMGEKPLERGCKLIDLLSRPSITIEGISHYIARLAELLECLPNRRFEITEAAEIQIKYKGYIEREHQEADKMQRLESIRIKGKFNYSSILSLSTEARQKLDRLQPETLSQASRIPGVSPSDINVLLVMMNR